MKKFIITEDEKRNILSLYGLNKKTINESKWKPCIQCMKNYSGSLDKCGFYAIERFEENYGDSNGQSLGNDYFEGPDHPLKKKYTEYDTIISDRLNNLIPAAWGSMDAKTKMQIWSFMYNSDSKHNDKFRWLAILYLTAEDGIKKFDEELANKIIDKSNPTEWDKAVNKVNATTKFNYNKLLDMIKGQYGTYKNSDTFNKQWSFRAKALDEMYDDCVNGIEPKIDNVNNQNINNKITPDNKSNSPDVTDKKTIDTSILRDSSDAKTILAGKKFIRLGQTSPLMSTIQVILKSLGKLPKDFEPSETYDKRTYFAIRRYQKEKRLKIDGIIGKRTLGALGLSGVQIEEPIVDIGPYSDKNKVEDIVDTRKNKEIDNTNLFGQREDNKVDTSKMDPLMRGFEIMSKSSSALMQPW